MATNANSLVFRLSFRSGLGAVVVTAHDTCMNLAHIDSRIAIVSGRRILRSIHWQRWVNETTKPFVRIDYVVHHTHTRCNNSTIHNSFINTKKQLQVMLLGSVNGQLFQAPQSPRQMFRSTRNEVTTNKNFIFPFDLSPIIGLLLLLMNTIYHTVNARVDINRMKLCYMMFVS